MHRWIRTVIVWLVALALPVQGFAAAAMISCGPMHGQMASALDHSAHHGDQEDADHSHHGDDALDGKSDTDEPPGLAKFFKFKCSACASCCTAATAPAPALPFPGVMQAHAAAIPFFGSAEETVVPDGLERPPRTSPA